MSTSYLSGSQQQALMGNWYSIVGQAVQQGLIPPPPTAPLAGNLGQQSGAPSNAQHGLYGGHHGQHAQLNSGQYRFPPRNGLEERGNPTRADREILPMSTGGTAVPFKVSAQITSRPQRVAFRPERVMISNGGTAFGSADWIVNDISIGNRSQFAQSGQVPGDMFAINAVDSFISFETAQTAMDIVMTVTYVGANVDPGSCPFYGSILGTSALY